ncbi:MAG: capsule assembly Wzi family protein [Geothrix sp.]|nr:capsule assembly Wzi family protein [Geothrix sp.]
MKRRRFRITAVGLMAVPAAWAQAPLLQDGAAALRQAQTAWTLGEPPLPPLSLPSFEVGLGGAESGGLYAPLNGGEGLGQGIQGWGLGLQGRYVQGGWSLSATVLGLRRHDHTSGLLHRAALAYQGESGWRVALEQGPMAWGSGLNGGELMGAAARPFPRVSLATPELELPFGRWRAEAFAGRLEWNRPIQADAADREARIAAQASGMDLRRPDLYGGILRAAFGTQVEASLGAAAMTGGRDARGQAAPAAAQRTAALAELKVRVPALASFTRAQGASLHLSRSAAPLDRSLTLGPGRNLAGLRLVWEGWDLGLEYAGAPSRTAPAPPTGPTYLADFSTHGDPLGSAFGSGAATRTAELGLPLFLEGRGRLKVVRAASSLDPARGDSWYLQTEAQWRTPTGRIGASLASRRNRAPAPEGRWGWALSVFQAFRVF